LLTAMSSTHSEPDFPVDAQVTHSSSPAPSLMELFLKNRNSPLLREVNLVGNTGELISYYDRMCSLTDCHGSDHPLESSCALLPEVLRYAPASEAPYEIEASGKPSPRFKEKLGALGALEADMVDSWYPPGSVPLCVLLDRSQRTILVLLRGTHHYNDYISDLCGTREDLRDLALHPFACCAHQGILHNTKNLYTNSVMLPPERQKWVPALQLGPSVSVNAKLWLAEGGAGSDFSLLGPAGAPAGAHLNEFEKVALFPEREERPRLLGILAVVQRLVDLSCRGVLDTDAWLQGTGAAADVQGVYKGWRVVTCGHSLGAGVASLLAIIFSKRLNFPGISLSSPLHEDCLLVPAVPVWGIGMGTPSTMSHALAANACCTVGERWALRQAAKNGELLEGQQEGFVFPRPAWWNPRNTWSSELPLFTTCIVANDCIPAISLSTVLDLWIEASHKANDSTSGKLGFKGVQEVFSGVGAKFGGWAGGAPNPSQTTAMPSTAPAASFPGTGGSSGSSSSLPPLAPSPPPPPKPPSQPFTLSSFLNAFHGSKPLSPTYYHALWAQHCTHPGQRLVPPGIIYHFTRVQGAAQGAEFQVEAKLAQDFANIRIHRHNVSDHAIYNPMHRLAR
jgi:hypothetical protein